MNEQELNLSKLSYVNKDFRSIYPDLLDLVKLFTNRWDPSSSNESDPGVVLLKVGAFLADHLNYNIDKNILEAFLPSATQEESVRKIAEFGGYTPRYYRSAVGKVTIAYNPEIWPGGRISFPEFSFVISNDDGSITYTQLTPFNLDDKNVPATADFIEGTIQRLTVDSDIITLDNIDDYRRIYFPNQYIAENGIFIYNVDENGRRLTNEGYSWERTNYIYTKPIGTRCFKIDFDSSKNLPYIEFPTDISNLIGSGLAIYYIYTAGSYGNVKAKELNTIVSISRNNLNELSVAAANDMDNFEISNSASITNGCEPESINEIYDSYKKVVGTFDTLVSTQDYSNAIRTAEDSVGSRYVSNGLITDRRCDYNDALNVLSSKVTGTYFTNVSLNFGKLVFQGSMSSAPNIPGQTEVGWVYRNTTNNSSYICTKVTKDTSKEPVEYNYEWTKLSNNTITSGELESYLDGMTPYDLIIYALQKYSESDYNSIYYWKALENSFKQIDGDAKIANGVTGTEDNLIAKLEDYKCINHTFRDLKDGQVYCFKNYVPLNVDIVPFNKVTKYERLEIISNIRKAISDNFNASKVEFGEELNYDEVKKVIENADPRINYIRLSDFDYHTKVMLKDSNDQLNAPELELSDSYEGSSFLVDLAAKNVLAGRLCLFEFDNNFVYKYGQKDCNAYQNITSIKTETTIDRTGDSQSESYPDRYEVTLENNEYLEILYPNYYSDKTYSSYVLYRLTLRDENGTKHTIAPGEDYTLKGDESLSLYYKDSDNKIHTEEYTAPTVIQPSFELKDFSLDQRTTFVKNGVEYKQIAANESISTRILLQTVFNTPSYVYWIMNNSANILFEEGESSKILDSGEYFIYTDSTKTNLTILGRGTKLERTLGKEEWSIPQSNSTKITATQLNDEGLSAKIPFINNIPFSENAMTVTEMNIITLGGGDTATFDAVGSSFSFKTIPANNISYTIKDNSSIELPPYAGIGNFYLIRSRFDINITTDEPMVLSNSRSIIKIQTPDSTDWIQIGGRADTPGTYIQSNTNLNLIGNTSDVSLDISTYADYGITINWMTYKIGEQTGSQLVRTDIKADTAPDPAVYTYPLWICSRDGTSFVKLNTQGDWNQTYKTYYICREVSLDGKIQYTYSLNSKLNEVKIPFSPIMYDYLSDHEIVIEREYICQLFLSNIYDEENTGKVKVRFEDGLGNDLGLGSYGHIDFDETTGEYFLINNQSTYVYPLINSEGISTINLVLSSDEEIPGGMVTIMDPVVVWGGNNDLGVIKSKVVARINNLLENSSDDSVQFHWLSNPKSEIAMNITNLLDPYSLFDHNNVASIITIPEIDLENSYIDIIKSMRNY